MKEVKKYSIPSNIQPYLNEIAEGLQSGHAAVMVGAGFSKNAKKKSASSPSFPEWAELGDLFYKKIHGKEVSKEDKYLSVASLAGTSGGQI